MRGARFILVAMLLATGCASPETVTVQVGTEVRLVAEVARTQDELQEGLAGRDDLAGGGMLFIFEEQKAREVWMAGVHMPLDVAWIVDHSVVEVRTLDPCRATDQQQCPRWKSPGVVDALLEVAAGELSSVRVGMTVTMTAVGDELDE